MAEAVVDTPETQRDRAFDVVTMLHNLNMTVGKALSGLNSNVAEANKAGRIAYEIEKEA